MGQQGSKATVLQVRGSSTDRLEQRADQLATSGRVLLRSKSYDGPANFQSAVGTKLCHRACLKVRKPSLVADCARGIISCCPGSRLKWRKRPSCVGSERFIF